MILYSRKKKKEEPVDVFKVPKKANALPLCILSREGLKAVGVCIAKEGFHSLLAHWIESNGYNSAGLYRKVLRNRGKRGFCRRGRSFVLWKQCGTEVVKQFKHPQQIPSRKYYSSTQNSRKWLQQPGPGQDHQPELSLVSSYQLGFMFSDVLN